MLARAFAVAAGLLAALAGQAGAQALGPAQVQVELRAARAAIAPGERFTVALRQVIRPGWHTYWRNPGAAGAPTEIQWRLPAGASAGPIQWPAPHRILFEGLANYGFTGEALLPVEITAPPNLAPGQMLTLSAHVSWVACADLCVFEEADVALALPVAAQGRDDPAWAGRIADVLAALPGPLEGVEARVTQGAPAELSIAGEALAGASGFDFFPYAQGAVDAAIAPVIATGPRGVSFALAPGADGPLGGAPLDGVLTFQDRAGAARAIEILAEPGPPLPGAGEPGPAKAAPLSAPAFIAALGLAFLGGLILNVMPCVLPVLSMKALSFAGGAHGGHARRHGLLYLGGVTLTFLALASVLIALRAGGQAVGWGFQLQTPWVTAGLALLFFAIGLNLAGLFSVGGGLQDLGAGWARGGGDAGAFFTGALAVIAATPCTAPFMAGAIGAALTQSAGATLAIFLALALGFSAPLTALGFAPGLRRLIPPPGPWMERVRNVLAFPMFAAAVWLAWVLAEQTGPHGVLALLALAAALAFALFVGGWGRGWAIAGLLALGLTGAAFWRPLAGQEAHAVLQAEPWRPGRAAQLQGEGRPVFVNFTAAWCVTCKVNELGALSSPRVAGAFADARVAYLKADWTSRDAVIAAALAEHGRAGVPLYLMYPAGGGRARVLPQILTEQDVLAALEGE